MTCTQHKASATLHYVALPEIWSFAAPISWALRKMGARIHRQDIGHTVDSLHFVTDVVDIRLTSAPNCLQLDALSPEDAARASDMCQYIERTMGRLARPRAVLWHPTPGSCDSFALAAAHLRAAAGRDGAALAGRMDYLH